MISVDDTPENVYNTGTALRSIEYLVDLESVAALEDIGEPVIGGMTV